ncbi:hypothetical protein HAX54_023287 [Datura stramonium]|uniref:Uncharacterized protein n=1 Tax=Datura stramonium TaxID=4076 RepID=A0ABS8S4J2_DATST|nr:hypothetical protein [Datura stramonium]
MNCGGPHFLKHCHTYGICGGLDGHLSHSPNYYSPSPSLYYDLPIVFDAYRNNKEEERHASMSNMEKLILKHMEGHLNEKVEVFEAQLQSVVDTSQCMEQEGESQPLDDSLVVDIDVEEVDKSEDVKHNAILELWHIGPHSKHFSTLCMVGNL